MIARWIGDGKSFFLAKKAEETSKNARRSITNSLKQP
jgi:hypothetical protein